jgi:hypothetical protein
MDVTESTGSAASAGLGDSHREPGAPQGERRAPPGRHGADRERARALAARLRMTIPGDPEPTQDQWHALGLALWRGDPMADAVIDWMRSVGRAQAWPLMERGLKQGGASLPDEAAPLKRFLLAHSEAPAWVNWARVRRGAQVLQGTGRHGMMVLRDAGLMAGYQAAAINQTLLKTGALQQGAHKRIAETATWWLACTEEDGLRPGQEGHRLTLHVRLMHALVRDQLRRAPCWDADWLGLPINQVDMQATYLAFSVVHLLGLRMTGMLFAQDDADAVMHLWRVMGWLVGVEDGLMCDDEASGRVLMYRNLITQAPPDETSAMLGRALMDEPLSRRYPWGSELRGRIDRERHLSLVRWFLGPEGMRNLGLPRRQPWYPLMLLAPTAAGSVALRTVPALEGPWRALARRQQKDYHNGLGLREPVAPWSGADGPEEQASSG